MKTYTQKEIVSIAIGALVLIAIGIFVFSRDKDVDTLPPVDTLPLTEVKIDEPKSTSTKDTTVKPVSLSYAQALETYKNKRIQLGAGDLCASTPALNTYKNNTSIMIDNRAPVARTIKLGGTNYSIGAYDFRIIKLSSATLPVTWLADCNAQQNVFTILLQK